MYPVLYDELNLEELSVYLNMYNKKRIVYDFYTKEQLEFINNILGLRAVKGSILNLKWEIFDSLFQGPRLAEINSDLIKNSISNYELVKPEVLETYIRHWKRTLKKAINNANVR